ncbi:MAG: hypothetical protein N2689_13890 [Verrucomicrobiae bacterium]|nr:hypothetical protein [Verrucomicrobiae bacterium]
MKTRQPRFQSSDDDSIVCFSAKDMAKRVVRRIFGFLRNAILWLLTLAPGILIIAYGANGILQKRLTHTGRYKGMTNGVSYGDDAVGWGWVFIGVGFWALGQFCALKTGREWFKFIGWILAIGSGGVGLWVLARRFI